MDKILITNLHAQGIIGVDAHESEIPQVILINITLDTDTRLAA